MLSASRAGNRQKRKHLDLENQVQLIWYVFSVLLAFTLALVFKLACAFAFPLTLFPLYKNNPHRAFPQPRAFLIDQRKGEGKKEGKGKGKFEGKGEGKG